MFDLLRRYRRQILIGGLILASLLFYSANLRRGGASTFFERSVLQITAPLHSALDVVWKGSADLWTHYLWLIDTGYKNDQLQTENRQLHAELMQVREIRLANERLRKLLDFKAEVDLITLPAQVISEDASSWFRTVVIDKGLDDGLLEGMPVVVAEGVVGRTIRVAAHQSRVLLITDASSAVASLVQKNRTRGICRGLGANLTLDFALRLEDIAAGDLIVTSGTGGVFPKGLTIGHVDEVSPVEYGLFQPVSVKPTVDFSRLEEVLVLLRENP
jgi:rod shape-determining protein MreC